MIMNIIKKALEKQVASHPPRPSVDRSGGDGQYDEDSEREAPRGEAPR